MKYTAKEIAEDNKLIDSVECGAIRKCSHCGFYVDVDDYCGEYTTKDNEIIYDACDDCCKKYDNNEQITYEEEEEYEDYCEDEAEME